MGWNHQLAKLCLQICLHDVFFWGGMGGMLVLGMRGETWLTGSRCDCPWLDPFDWSMSKDVVFNRKDEVWSSSIIQVIVMNEHPNSFETSESWKLSQVRAQPRGQIILISSSVYNVLLVLCFWWIMIHTPTITYNDIQWKYSMFIVCTSTPGQAMTYNNLNWSRPTSPHMPLFDRDLPMVSLVVHDGAWSS